MKMSNRPKHRMSGVFTLIELLLAIAGFIVLTTVILGGVPQTRDKVKARRITGVNYLHQIVVSAPLPGVDHSAKFPVEISIAPEKR